jgi:hypothetical protein
MKALLYAVVLLMPNLPVLAATPIDETRPVAADAVIEVGNVAGSIRVRGSDRRDVRITGSVGEGAKGLLVEGDERRLRIRIDYPRGGGGWGGWWGGGTHGNSVLELEVPRGVELKVEAVSAKVDVAGVAGRRVEIDAVSGNVRFEGAPAELEIEAVSGSIEVVAGGIGEVVLETVSGRVGLSGAVGSRLRAESVSGAMRLHPEGALRQLQASAVSGRIEIRTALAPAGRLNAETLSGELDVVLPRNTSAELSASSFSGSIRSDVGSVEKESFGPGSSLKATMGAGDGQVRLESFSGTLRLRLE